MDNTEVATAPRSQYVDFWNTVLVPKFVRWRHILVGGLTMRSAKVFPSLAVNKRDKVVDAGCGFGDTAIQLARLVGLEAVRLIKDRGVWYVQASQDLGVHTSQPRDWVKKLADGSAARLPRSGALFDSNGTPQRTSSRSLKKTRSIAGTSS